MLFATTDTIVNYSWIERTTEWSQINDSIILTSAITSSTPLPTASSSAENNVVVITEDSNPTSSSSIQELTTPYGPAASVIIALVLLCVIVGTIVGNILVCVAVCLVRKLRRPCNYLLVSLAVSDLCVAILVMPVALLYEILGRWSFGPVICDLWVSFDVLSCTASILNLCMISVDRYYAITKPLEYGVKRTPRRMIACVSLVWLGAACISLPPLLILGNEHGEDGTSCSVCQNFGYQIYATLGSFYIPLSVMIVVYHKIFQAARKIVLEERRAQSHLRLTSSNMAADDHHLNPQQYLNNQQPVISDKIVVVTEISKNGNATPETRLASPSPVRGGATDGANNPVSWQPGMQTNRERNSTASTNTNVSVNDSGVSRCFGSQRKRRNQQDVEYPLTSGNEGVTNIGPGSKTTNKRDSTLSNEPATSSGRKKLLQQPHIMSKSRLRFTLAKERKASTTLGIIMSAFTICWLPFFVLALVRPFLLNQDGIPQSLSSLFLWLGYANSLLNPIIYATLNKDFRKPFQQILYFRCSSLNLMMREEFYHSQYGDPNLTIAGPTTRHRGGEEIHFYGGSDEFGGGGAMQYNRVGTSGEYHECIVPPTATTQLAPVTSAEDENDTYTSEHDESFL